MGFFYGYKYRMSFRIKCYVLFDITSTGVINRTKPGMDVNSSEWLLKRNTQCNFDTLIQAISLRSQPEVVGYPTKTSVQFDKFDKFGFLFEQDEECPCWTFEFDIQHPSVFDDGISELGSLYKDCDTVPMIKCGTEWDKLPAFPDATDELRNIYFEVIDNG